MSDTNKRKEVDPGDSVPEGVAPLEPPALSEEEQKVKEKLEQIGNKPKPKGPPDS
ncbi:hypothetical protein [Sabulicella rubraurantiaca]|uniref:hypothetical protein n=1 Tax=Sabulicella rubraurantiaca TaxID=2811429 RepID=UPI001A96EA5A|nr:hypothetical protein [Sabulicella rubraurantiaca]